MKSFLLLATLLLTTTVWADPLADKVYKQLDRNKDGKVTDQEFIDEIVLIAFVRMDANGDATIDLVEWSQTEKGDEGKAAFSALDSNSDGTLDRTEYTQNPTKRAVIRRIFLTVDPNDDGILTVEEIPANAAENN